MQAPQKAPNLSVFDAPQKLSQKRVCVHFSSFKSNCVGKMDNTVLGYSIISYLKSLEDDKYDQEKLKNVTNLLQEIFSVDMESIDDFKKNSLYPSTLNEIVTSGCAALDTETYEKSLSTCQTNGKYDAFVETVTKKGFYKGVEEGSLEYLQRHSKVLMKFKEKVNAKTSGNNEAAAEAKKAEGNAHVTKKDYRAAVASYTEALQLSPAGQNSHIYFTNRAAAHCYLRNYESAIADCEAAIKLDPFYVKAYSRLGLAHFFMNNYEEAVVAYQKAVDLEPDTKALKDSLRQAKQKLDEKNVVPSSSSGSHASAPSAGAGGPGMGGMPDMSALASMMGGADGGGLAALMQNPQVMQAAQQMMQNPAMMQQAMSMMNGAGGMPDMAAMQAMMAGASAGAADNKKSSKRK